MPSLPDIATLRLCSSLATSALAAVFLVPWAGRRDETHWPCRAAGAAAYAAILAGFAASTHHLVTARLPSPRDLAVRLGGDGFAIAPREVPGLPAWTASLGVALSRPDDRTLADTMARADGALYRAKATGRDRAG
ncbi:diguanylate cyclase [Methylobacterium sp. 17Sr1-1]|uniref:diguanylate cyclase n=1 Tax=Methylobacterium sp. 17Sr1-1 TaxID=2202826 RepID=UPI000D6F6EAE|nr:diguanylate cyclase [Methylobacterium sp. 17Sr1-1]AWN55275.1 hypothetical protein DK412_29660 [Methylobacterium sp. 17Sr1-1]